LEILKQQLDESLKLTTELKMFPHIAHCHMVRAKLYQQIGDEEEAERALNAALSIYTKLDMPFWIEKCQLEKQIKQ